MKIEFANDNLRSMANDIKKLDKLCHKNRTTFSGVAIIETLDILQAAPTLFDVPQSLRPHPLRGKYKNCFAVRIDKKFRVIFHPDHKGDLDYRIDNPRTIENIIIDNLCVDYHK